MKSYISMFSLSLFISLFFLLSTNAYGQENQGITIDNTEILRASDFSLGLTVNTLGYYTNGDGGGATYIITDTVSGSVDNIFIIPIQNQKFAQLVTNQDSILNVASAGIFPDNNISTQLNTLITNGSGRIKGIKFNSGKYYLDSAVYLQDMEFYGAADSTLSVSPAYSTMRYGIITSEKLNAKYVFDNIHFEYNTSDSHLLANKESVLLALSNISSCIINNCSFTASNSSDNSTGITLLWFRHSEIINNVSINNCSFTNLIGDLCDSNKIIRGGCIWFNGLHDICNNSFNNISINNCSITNTTTDESIAFWNGKINNVNILNTTIHAKKHTTNNVMSLYECEYHNFLIDNVQFITSSIAKNVVIIRDITSSSDIIVKNCSFTLNAGSVDPHLDARTVFFIHNDPFNSSSQFINNIISSQSQTTYCSFVYLLNAMQNQIEIFNNNINLPLLYGFLHIETSSNICARISSNTITNSSFAATATTCNNSTIVMNNNIIKNGYSLLVREPSSFQYYVENNQICYELKEPFVTYKTNVQNNCSIVVSEKGNI